VAEGDDWPQIKVVLTDVSAGDLEVMRADICSRMVRLWKFPIGLMAGLYTPEVYAHVLRLREIPEGYEITFQPVPQPEPGHGN
jgi:hypothetical protein